jgi:hypothetical protein
MAAVSADIFGLLAQPLRPKLDNRTKMQINIPFIRTRSPQDSIDAKHA